MYKYFTFYLSFEEYKAARDMIFLPNGSFRNNVFVFFALREPFKVQFYFTQEDADAFKELIGYKGKIESK